MSSQSAVEQLRAVRPDLVEPFHAALDVARSAVLARLWGAFAREPLPGIEGRHYLGDTLVVMVTDGGQVAGPASAAARFAQVPPGFVLAGPDGPVGHPSQLLATLGLSTPGARRLTAELENSVVNLALARTAGDSSGSVTDSVGAEQAVRDGHPQHPCCRTRMGMSVAEVLAYAPEYHPTVDLALLAVPVSQWLGSGVWPEELREGETVLVPVHPWQRDHVVGGYPELVVTGHTIAARPLLSLRTLAPKHTLRGCHIKTALDVQITSRRRNLSPAEVVDGPVLSEFLTGIIDKVGYSNRLRVLSEVGGGAVRIDGRPCASLAAMVRRSTEQDLAAGETVVPLTAVYATDAAWVTEDPVHWLTELTELVLPPALTLMSQGIALEAHGQNTLVVLHGGRPVRVLYRDVDGVRLNPARLSANGIALPTLTGDRVGKDVPALRAKLFGSLLSGTFSELVTVLARTRGVEPGTLWAAVAKVARRAFAALPANSDAEAFFGAVWPLKATTAMRLADDPRPARWVDIPNPVYAQQRPARTCSPRITVKRTASMPDGRSDESGVT
ncbi:IucA/IucC family protein [Kitasatospora sp. NPDC052896]|uniref:IucA/IucC family protein n=1 Tax=Kitasatospora sp. NPDC052896 TaxID=3364061 RepID=UPI0037C67CD4